MAKSSYEELEAELIDAPTIETNLSNKSRSGDNELTYTEKKYFYQFGIDSVSFSQVTIHENMCFVSPTIEVGTLGDDEYLQLTADYSTGENGSVEFYLIDGVDQIPILPITSPQVINEKIFYGLRSRFSVDTEESVIIKKNGVKVDITMEQAVDSNDAGYTATYYPLDAYNKKTSNEEIKVKAILRTYDVNGDAPVVKNIAIRKYGRSSVWKSDTIN